MTLHTFRRKALNLLSEEWLFFTALTGLVATSCRLERLPTLHWGDLEPIWLLWGLFVSIRGIERSHLLCRVARWMEWLPLPAVSLVLLGFALGMFLTIDVALVTLVPIIFAMKLRGRIRVLLLSSFAAHAGAALLPFGTPQNLFIYAHFRPGLMEFVTAIAPLSFGLLGLFLLAGILSGVRLETPVERPRPKALRRSSAILYPLFFLLCAAAVLGLLPSGIVLLPLLYAWLVDQETLKVDYFLLLTFVIFLALAANVRMMVAPWLHRGEDIFILSALLSQFISNVPTTLLLEPITTHWRSLLWGTNVGGFGTPLAALANLILIRLYRSHAGSTRGFMIPFWLANIPVLLLGIALYYALRYL